MKLYQIMRFAQDESVSKEKLAAIVDTAFLQQPEQAVGAKQREDNGWRTTQGGKHYKINPKSGKIVAGNIGVAKQGDKVQSEKKTGKMQNIRATAKAKKQAQKVAKGKYTNPGRSYGNFSADPGAQFGTGYKAANVTGHESGHSAASAKSSKKMSSTERFFSNKTQADTEKQLNDMPVGSVVTIGSTRRVKLSNGSWGQADYTGKVHTDPQNVQSSSGLSGIMHSGIDKRRMRVQTPQQYADYNAQMAKKNGASSTGASQERASAGASSASAPAKSSTTLGVQKSLANGSARGAAAGLDKYAQGTSVTFSDGGKEYTYEKQPDKNGLSGNWLQKGTKNGFATSQDIAYTMKRNGGKFSAQEPFQMYQETSPSQQSEKIDLHNVSHVDPKFKEKMQELQRKEWEKRNDHTSRGWEAMHPEVARERKIRQMLKGTSFQPGQHFGDPDSSESEAEWGKGGANPTYFKRGENGDWKRIDPKHPEAGPKYRDNYGSTPHDWGKATPKFTVPGSLEETKLKPEYGPGDMEALRKLRQKHMTPEEREAEFNKAMGITGKEKVIHYDKKAAKQFKKTFGDF